MSLYHWAATVLEPQTANLHFEELSSALPELLKAAPHGHTAFTPSVVEVYARAGHVDRAIRELDDAIAFVEGATNVRGPRNCTGRAASSSKTQIPPKLSELSRGHS